MYWFKRIYFFLSILDFLFVLKKTFSSRINILFKVFGNKFNLIN